MKKTYKSSIAAAVHETMQDIYGVGGIDRQTMRKFDEMCLAPVQNFTGEDIRDLRERENLSQPVFARYMNVSKTIVSEWERGIKKPGGPALRLLSLIKQHGIEIFTPAS